MPRHAPLSSRLDGGIIVLLIKQGWRRAVNAEGVHEILQSLRDVGTDLTHVKVKRAERGLPKRLWETLSASAKTAGAA